ncbi:potassium channel family protein [Streptomyces sp. NPDC002405]|uniref:potassium channel family protein n=1 Tax=Streptomyces sp. NPDC001231 TaxID=3364549 RepID=UPI00368BB128
MSDSAAPRTPNTAGRRPPRRDREQRVPRSAAAMVLARSVFVTAGLVTAYYLLPLDGRASPTTAVLLGLGLLGVALFFGWEVWAIARSPYPRLKAVEALAITLPLFLLLFAGAYYLLDHSDPSSFTEPLTRTDALYFALTTFTTVGYGDITARSQTGRVLAMLQMAGGLLLVGVAARVLTGAIQAGLRQQHRDRPPG